MRTVISVSATKTDISRAKKRMEQRGFENMSAYIRALFEEDRDIPEIKDADLVKRARRVDRLYGQGRLIKADSLVDLIKGYGG